MTQTENENKAISLAEQKIAQYGIRESIIKRENTTIKNPYHVPPQGVLILTKTDLYFFGANYDFQFPIKSISSTSCDNSDLIILNQQSQKYIFRWNDVSQRNTGAGVVSGSLAAGSSYTKTANPSPKEWQQLIDDIRFGKITFDK